MIVKENNNSPELNVLEYMRSISTVLESKQEFATVADWTECWLMQYCIQKYKKAYKKEDGKHYTLCFFESQIAAMIRFFADTVEMIMPQEDDDVR